MTLASDYRLVLAQRSGSGLGTSIISDVLVLGVQEQLALRWSRALNAAGAIEFTLPIDSSGVTPANFAVGERELHLYRNAGAGESLVWTGRLWAADVRMPWVRFAGFGFWEDLRHREISDDFYKFAVDQRTIAWDAINYTQTQTNGNIGITFGTATGAAVITRTIESCAEERQLVTDLIEDMAGADDGFDFEVSPDKSWKTWTPSRGTDLSGTVILNTTTQISDLSYTIDATKVENDVAGIGEKGDCEPITYLRQTDSASQTKFGLMQGTLSRSDLKQDDDMLLALTRSRLALAKIARRQPTVRCYQQMLTQSPLSGDFSLGDSITITASKGFATFSEKFRLLAYDVSVDHMGNEQLDLTVSAVL